MAPSDVTTDAAIVYAPGERALSVSVRVTCALNPAGPVTATAASRPAASPETVSASDPRVGAAGSPVQSAATTIQTSARSMPPAALAPGVDVAPRAFVRSIADDSASRLKKCRDGAGPRQGNRGPCS